MLLVGGHNQWLGGREPSPAGGDLFMKRVRSGAFALGALVCALAVLATSAVAQTSNRAPRITSAAATPTAGYGAPLSVTFSAVATDADGDALTYSWSFGDGSTSSAQNPTHSYEELGYFDATLTVTDSKGATATRTIQVNVLSTERDPDARFRILVFSKTAAFRHSSIDEGVTAIRKLGAENDFQVDASEEASLFTDENLALYDAVVFLSTTGDVLNEQQQAAFERYIQAGGGYVGIHAASDTEYTWKWYGELVGAYFRGHPAQQTASIDIEDTEDHSTRGLPERWTRFDEWYDFKPINFEQTGNLDYSPRGEVHVLASLDESTYTGEATGTTDHPISWCQRYDGGRSWYTALGHTEASYLEPEFLRHILGGIEVAAGVATSKACGRKGWHGTNPKRQNDKRDHQHPGRGNDKRR
jgi:type 1 glutamine amidotransferase